MMSWKTLGKSLVVLGACGAIASLYTTYWQPPSQTEQRQAHSLPQSCQVLKIFDGDTLGCDLNQNRRIERPDEFVRLIGIDAPEMHYSKKNKTGRDQPYAVAAMRLIEATVLHHTVYLEQDHRKRDRYGRILAYVYQTPTDSVTLNEKLLEAGYATLLFIPPNEKYRTRFEAVLTQAQQSHQGLWQAAAKPNELPLTEKSPVVGSVDLANTETAPSH